MRHFPIKFCKKVEIYLVNNYARPNSSFKLSNTTCDRPNPTNARGKYGGDIYMEDYPLDIFWIFTPHRTSYDSTIEGPLRVAGTCRPRAATCARSLRPSLRKHHTTTRGILREEDANRTKETKCASALRTCCFCDACEHRERAIYIHRRIRATLRRRPTFPSRLGHKGYH
jgi:hypothetical protein